MNPYENFNQTVGFGERHREEEMSMCLFEVSLRKHLLCGESRVKTCLNSTYRKFTINY